MKFNKRNILFKLVFLFLIAFICLEVDKVDATDAESATLSSIMKKDKYCRYVIESTKGVNGVSTFEEITVSYSGSTFVYFAGVRHNPETLGNSLKEMTVLSSDASTLYCPETVLLCSDTSIYNTKKSTKERKDYIASSDDDCRKKLGVSEKRSISTEVITLIKKDSKKANAYKYTTNNGPCIHTSNDAGFAGIYQSAKELKNATVYDDKYASKANQIDKYVDNNKNKAFCDVEQFKYLQEAINNWNTVVSKDPSANKTQKDKAQEQTENTTKNIETIISNMQNSANVSMPNDNPVQNTCEGLIDEDLKRVIDIVLNAVRIVVPILLIVLIAVDFGQVVISNDKEAMPKAISKAIKRGIAAIVIFFIPFLVDLIIDWLNTYSGINGAANCIK